jgi:phage tail sheath gpL-like
MVAADDGSVFTSRIVTTYKRNAQGVQDDSFLQLETVLTLSYLRWYWNNYLASKYSHAKLKPDGTKVASGQQIMTPSLGKAELIACYEKWEEAGLVYDSKGFAENLVVELDPNDPYAMNFFIPVHLVKQFFVSKSKIVHD